MSFSFNEGSLGIPPTNDLRRRLANRTMSPSREWMCISCTTGRCQPKNPNEPPKSRFIASKSIADMDGRMRRSRYLPSSRERHCENVITDCPNRVVLMEKWIRTCVEFVVLWISLIVLILAHGNHDHTAVRRGFCDHNALRSFTICGRTRCVKSHIITFPGPGTNLIGTLGYASRRVTTAGFTTDNNPTA